MERCGSKPHLYFVASYPVSVIVTLGVYHEPVEDCFDCSSQSALLGYLSPRTSRSKQDVAVNSNTHQDFLQRNLLGTCHGLLVAMIVYLHGVWLDGSDASSCMSSRCASRCFSCLCFRANRA